MERFTGSATARFAPRASAAPIAPPQRRARVGDDHLSGRVEIYRLADIALRGFCAHRLTLRHPSPGWPPSRPCPAHRFLHRPPRRRTRGRQWAKEIAPATTRAVYSPRLWPAEQRGLAPPTPARAPAQMPAVTMTGWVLTVLLSSSAGLRRSTWARSCLRTSDPSASVSRIAGMSRSRPASHRTATLAGKNHRELSSRLYLHQRCAQVKPPPTPWSMTLWPGLMRPRLGSPWGRAREAPRRRCICRAVHGDDELDGSMRVSSRSPRVCARWPDAE